MRTQRPIVAIGVAMAALIAVGASTGPVAAIASSVATVVVDDDAAQCANPDYSSIADAVANAPAGATVKVCPGLYRERVEIDKPLHLVGQPDAVEAIDCFDPTWTATTALDTTALPVLERPLDDNLGETPAPLIRLNADGVEVAGLAVRSQAQPAAADSTYTPAIQADGAHSGYQIHKNLIQGNDVPVGQTQDRTFGIELGSDGTAESRVDHNCLRGNTWALANQRYTAAALRVDHNDTYRQGSIAYEIGVPNASTSDVRLDHNRSISVGVYAFRIESSSDVLVDHNHANGGIGVFVASGNKDVEISANQLTGGTVGVSVPGSPTPVTNPSTGVVVNGNTVEGYSGNGISVALNANTSDLVITENVVRDNGLSGIQIGLTNTGALVQGNTSDGNASFGIRTISGVAGNTFLANSMYGNGVDAFEGTVRADGTLGNTWTDNRCETDSVSGAICTSP